MEAKKLTLSEKELKILEVFIEQSLKEINPIDDEKFIDKETYDILLNRYLKIEKIMNKIMSDIRADNKILKGE